MKIYFQGTGLKTTFDAHLLRVMEGCKTLGFTYQDFGTIPKTKEFVNFDSLLDEDEPFFIYGSTKFIEFFADRKNIENSQELFPYLSLEDSQKLFKKINKNVIYDYEFYDQEYMVKNNELGPFFLNSDATFHNLDDILDKHIELSFFKPVNDLKDFAGNLVENTTIREWFTKQSIKDDLFTKNPRVMLADPKNIMQEVRCFVMNGKVVDIAQYRKNGHGNLSAIDPPVKEKYTEFLNNRIHLLNGVDALVIDLCLRKNGDINIVETNCIHASGLYNVDILKYLKGLEEVFEKRYKKKPALSM